jgi:hypothetical protein
LPSVRWRQLRSSRQLSQGVVEFGLSIAAVAFVALVGFSALGHAQAAYWGATAPQVLDQPAPAPGGTFLHHTTATLTCDRSKLIYGDTVNCTIVIVDVAPLNASLPFGTAGLSIDNRGTPVMCSAALAPIAGSPPATSCVVSWQPGSGDVGTRILKPVYVPGDTDHGTPTAVPSYTLVVQPAVTVAIDPTAGCRVRWTGTAPPWNVEIGHPVICTVSVQDSSSHAINGAVVDWHATPIVVAGTPIGAPTFTCFTNDSYAGLQNCQKPAPSYSCTTDATGTCSVIFREYPASDGDTLKIPGKPVTLSAVAFPTDNPAEHVATAQLTIAAPGSDHGAGFSVDCATAVPPVGGTVKYVSTTWPVANRTNRSVPSLAEIHVKGPGATPTATVTCTVVVYDPSASASFDGPPLTCTNSGGPGDPCNPDDQDSYSPFGYASLQQVPSPPPAPPPPLLTCPNPGLTAQPHPVNMLPLYDGQPEYASACQIVLTLSGPVGSSVGYTAQYSGESVPPAIRQHAPAASPSFTVFYEN